MLRLLTFLACVLLLLGACRLGPYTPSAANRAECERAGWTPGTRGYDRCIRNLEGRDVIESGRRDRNLPAGR